MSVPCRTALPFYPGFTLEPRAEGAGVALTRGTTRVVPEDVAIASRRRPLL